MVGRIGLLEGLYRTVVVGWTPGSTRQGENRMSRPAFITKIVAKPGKREELKKLNESVCVESKQEPGTLVYVMSQSSENPDEFWYFDCYADQKAFEVHCASAPFKHMTASLGDIVAHSGGDIDGWLLNERNTPVIARDTQPGSVEIGQDSELSDGRTVLRPELQFQIQASSDGGRTHLDIQSVWQSKQTSGQFVEHSSLSLALEEKGEFQLIHPETKERLRVKLASRPAAATEPALKIHANWPAASMNGGDAAFERRP